MKEIYIIKKQDGFGHISFFPREGIEGWSGTLDGARRFEYYNETMEVMSNEKPDSKSYYSIERFFIND